MDILHITGVAGIVFLAGLIQSAIGLGYALIAVPSLVLSGMTLPSAIATMYVCSFVQSVFGVSHLRSFVPWKLSLTASSVNTATAVAGLLALKKIAFLDPETVKAVVGCFLCSLSAIQLAFTSRPLKLKGRIWSGLSFSLSGLLTGVCGMGGPPLVIWSISQGWAAQKTRGFLFSVYIILIPTQLFLLYIIFSDDIIRAVSKALIFIPAAIAGTAVGLPLGNRMSKEILAKIVNLILLIIGLSLAARTII